LFAALLFQDTLMQSDGVDHSLGTSGQLGLRLAQLVIVTLAGFSSISIPRRPEVFHAGKPVDGMYTVSAFERYTFAWVAHLLALSRSKNRLELDDLPKMDHHTRSKDLSEEWATKTRTRKLWIEIFLAHKGPFMLQVSDTSLASIFLLASLVLDLYPLSSSSLPLLD
jgi:hypothetical protein